MAKLAFWAEPELEERLSALHKAMQKDSRLRSLKLTKTAVLKMLIQESLEWAELEYLRTLPDGVDAGEVIDILEGQMAKRRAILDEMIYTWNAEMRKGKVPPKKPKK